MRTFLFCLFLFTLPLKVQAKGIEIRMTDITQNFYFDDGKDNYWLYYQLKAKESIRHKTKDAFKLSRHKETAKQLLEYKDGSLTFANTSIRFRSAYYFRGVFYMQRAFGEINGRKFSSSEIGFDKKTQSLTSTRIVFPSGNVFRIESNFKQKLPHQKLPLEKISN